MLHDSKKVTAETYHFDALLGSNGDVPVTVRVLVVPNGPSKQICECLLFSSRSIVVRQQPGPWLESSAHKLHPEIVRGKSAGIPDRDLYLLEGLKDRSVVVAPEERRRDFLCDSRVEGS